MIKEIIKYELSGDKMGLLAYIADDIFYHIHSDELSATEKGILEELKRKK